MKKITIIGNTIILTSLAILMILSILGNFRQINQTKKDQIIIRVLLTYHRDVLGHNLNPDLIYEDGLRWVDNPIYNAVEYPKK